MGVLSGPLAYVLLGYFSGSVLYSELFMRLFHGESLMKVSANHNPGASNAFIYGGFWCGTLAVAGDILKGMLPVWLYCRRYGIFGPWVALVMAAPVLGHAHPCFFGFKGGMCIATTFGVLLGLLPLGRPVIILAALYLGLLLVPGINNSLRSIFAFVALPVLGFVGACLGRIAPCVAAGMLLVSLVDRKRIWPDLTSEDQERFSHLRLPGDMH